MSATSVNFIAEKDLIPRDFSGSFSSSSPSNIALVKYWGKFANQIPANPSLSFTLSESKTNTQLKVSPKTGKNSSINFYFHGKKEPSFIPKIEQFFSKIDSYCPYLERFDFEIYSENTFPHSSGIASSASAMSALALCVMKLEKKFNQEISEEDFLRKASFLSRLGSGSASRSVYPGVVLWGNNSGLISGSNEFAIPISENIHPIYKTFQDTILLIDVGQKQVSSSAGHALMNNHPYSGNRFQQADKNLQRLLEIMKTDNLFEFGKLVEHEALSLHAMMMTSDPAYILIKPNTLKAIHALWNFRKDSQLPLFFTLDAGANVHLLYPESVKNQAVKFIKNTLKTLCENGKYIQDKVADSFNY